MSRRPYIDWLRGLAVLFMIEWHVIDAWSLTTGRETAAFDVAGFVGGWAAPLFLWLAGVSVALAGESALIRKAGSAAAATPADRLAAAWRVQKRGWQIFLAAHLFRLQSFLLNTSAEWAGLFRPDILNILGLGMVGTAFVWGRARRRRDAIWWIGVPCALVILLSPWSRGWWWPTLLPHRLEAYIRPVGGFGVFQLFPSVAYVFAGGLMGAAIANPRPPQREARFHGWVALAGLGLLAAGEIGSYLPPLVASSEFWSTSISIFLMRVGAMTLALSAAWLWGLRPTARRWSPLVLFGRTSLFVYWVHVELAYGIFSIPLHHALPLPQAAAGFVAITLLMLGLAWLWDRRARGPLIPAELRAPINPLVEAGP